jgi:hypothetical protein
MRGLAIAAGILAAVAGAIWAPTSSFPAGCRLTGQLEGQTCYPELVNIHSITGPVALVLAVATVVFVVAAASGQAATSSAIPAAAVPASGLPAPFAGPAAMHAVRLPSVGACWWALPCAAWQLWRLRRHA